MIDNNIFTAGSCDSDSCGCITHEDSYFLGYNNLETLQAGDCGSDSCGSFTHTNILIA